MYLKFKYRKYLKTTFGRNNKKNIRLSLAIKCLQN